MKQINRYVKQALGSTGLRQSIMVSVGNASATVVSAVALIIYSRVMGPKDFGTFSAAFSLLLLLARVLDGGISYSVQRLIAKRPPNFHDIVYTGLITKAAISIASFSVSWLVGPWLARHILKIDDPTIITLSLVLLGITFMFDYAAYTLMGLQRFKEAVLASLTQAFSKLAGAVFLVATSLLTPVTGFVVYAIAPITALALVTHTFRQQGLGMLKKQFNLKPILNTMRFMGVWVIAGAVAEHFDVLMVKSLLSSTETGLYSAAQKIAMFPTFIGVTLTTVLSVRVARYHQLSDLTSYLKKAIVLSVIVMVSSLFILPLSRLALLLTAGEAYTGAATPLTFLLIAVAIFVAQAPFDALFYLFKRPQYYAIKGTLLIISLVVGDLILIPRFGLIGAGSAQVIMRLTLAVFTLWYAYRSYQEFVAEKRA